MHGLPAISVKDSLSGPPSGPAGAGRSTMFGLPAIKESVGEESSGAEKTEAEDAEDLATRVSGTMLGASFRVSGQDSVRTTAMGGLPTIQRPEPAEPKPGQTGIIKPPARLANRAPGPTSTTMFNRPVLDPWAGDEEESDPEAGATMVAPSSAFSEEDDPRDHSGFSRFGQRVGSPVGLDRTSSYKPDPMNQNATLMGMSIDKLASDRGGLDVRKTTFALPNPLAAESPERMIAEEDADDLPTQNITPEDLEQAGQGASSERNDTRKRLLEKLRTTTQREAAAPEPSMRSTMFGIPGVSAASGPTNLSDSGVLRTKSAPRQTEPPAPAAAAAVRTTATSGLFKVARRNVDEDGNPLEDSGVLGRGAYMVGRGEIKKEHTGSLSRQLVDQALASSTPEPTLEPRSMGRENDERSETFGRPHAEPMSQRSMGRENDERSETFGRSHAEPMSQRSMGRENDERSETFGRPYAEPMNQRAPSRPLAATPHQPAPRNTQPWIDPDQSQMPGMFGESTAAISAEQLRMVNATAALSPEHLGRDLLAMRAEPEEAAQSDSTRVGGADLGGMFGAEPLPSASASSSSAFDAATRVGGADLFAQAQSRFPIRESKPTPASEAPARPIATPTPADLGNLSRPGQRVNAWREAAEEANIPEPTLNMFDPAQLPPRASLAPSLPTFAESAPLADEPTTMHPSTIARQTAAAQALAAQQRQAQPTPADPFASAFQEERHQRAGQQPGGFAGEFRAPAGEQLAPLSHELDIAPHVVPVVVEAQPQGIGPTLGKVFGALSALCMLGGVGLGAAASLPALYLGAPVVAALLVLGGALAPLPSVAKLGMVTFASILALGIMGLILMGGALSIPALLIGAGGLFGLLAAALPALLK